MWSKKRSKKSRRLQFLRILQEFRRFSEHSHVRIQFQNVPHLHTRIEKRHSSKCDSSLVVIFRWFQVDWVCEMRILYTCIDYIALYICDTIWVDSCLSFHIICHWMWWKKTPLHLSMFWMLLFHRRFFLIGERTSHTHRINRELKKKNKKNNENKPNDEYKTTSVMAELV